MADLEPWKFCPNCHEMFVGKKCPHCGTTEKGERENDRTRKD